MTVKRAMPVKKAGPAKRAMPKKRANPNRRPGLELRWRRGQPDQAGWWFLWSDASPYGLRPPTVKIVEMYNPAGVKGVGAKLFILGFPNLDQMVAADTFQGTVAGPIPEPAHD